MWKEPSERDLYIWKEPYERDYKSLPPSPPCMPRAMATPQLRYITRIKRDLYIWKEMDERDQYIWKEPYEKDLYIWKEPYERDCKSLLPYTSLNMAIRSHRITYIRYVKRDLNTWKLAYTCDLLYVGATHVREPYERGTYSSHGIKSIRYVKKDLNMWKLNYIWDLLYVGPIYVIEPYEQDFYPCGKSPKKETKETWTFANKHVHETYYMWKNSTQGTYVCENTP